MSLELTQFPSFLWLSNIPLSIYETQLLHPLRYRWTSRLLPCPGCCKQRCSGRWGTHTTVSLSTDGHLGCFCILTVVNNGQMPLWDPDSNSPGHIPKSGISGSYGRG